jgi:ribosomal protein S18 acetylase RimI-like enzyme
MSEVAERAHQNLCNFIRFQARLDAGSELLDRAGIVAMSGTPDFPTSRSAIRSTLESSAAEWADALTTFFDARGKSGCVFARVGADDDLNDELSAREFREWALTPEMVCDHRLDDREPPAGVSVRWATTPEDVSAYADIAGKAFVHLSVPENITRDAVDNPAVMLGSDCVIALADLDGVPVAGALVVLFGAGDPGAYVSWVACLDAGRGRGLGDIVTRAVTNAAFDRGSSLVTLEASPFGKSTYARMGYEEIYNYRILIRL